MTTLGTIKIAHQIMCTYICEVVDDVATKGQS